MNITGLNRLGFGVECQVYEVNDKIVCKNFARGREKPPHPEPKRAQFAYRMQKIAYRYGLAPRPLAIEHNQYYSERATSVDITGYDGLRFRFKESKEYQKFSKQLEKIIGGEFADGHSGNIARLPNGELCCIDFGICGMSLTKIGKLLADKIGITDY